MSGYSVFECAAQPTAVMRGSLTVAELPAFFGRAFTAVAEALCARGTPPTQEPFAYYPTMPGATIDVEAGFPVSEPIQPTGEVMPSTLPAGTVVTTAHVGPYNTLEQSYRALSEWAAAHELTPTGPMWEVYLTDPEKEPDPAKWQTDVFVYVVGSPVTALAR